MQEDRVSTIEQVIDPLAASAILVEDASKAAQNLCWDDRNESLWWTDIAGGHLHRFNFNTRIKSTVCEGLTEWKKPSKSSSPISRPDRHASPHLEKT